MYVKEQMWGSTGNGTKMSLTIHNPIKISYIFVTIKLKNIEFLLGCIYRPPRCPLDENPEFCNAFDNFCNKLIKKEMILFGDLNYKEINWEFSNLSEPNPAAQQFLTAYNNSHLHQLIDFPTHFKDNTRPSLIDILLTSNEAIMSESVVVYPLEVTMSLY